ncbi:uncharacterized protein [Dysidea avara]|uniref:uncharacterized protein n=1 Tax=Dysidea avara TaxID=196820 RepID=UPI00331A2C24
MYLICMYTEGDWRCVHWSKMDIMSYPAKDIRHYFSSSKKRVVPMGDDGRDVRPTKITVASMDDDGRDVRPTTSKDTEASQTIVKINKIQLTTNDFDIYTKKYI